MLPVASPQRYTPAHVGAAAATPGEGDGPRRRETNLGRGNHAPESAAGTRPCAAARRSLLDPAVGLRRGDKVADRFLRLCR